MCVPNGASYSRQRLATGSRPKACKAYSERYQWTSGQQLGTSPWKIAVGVFGSIIVPYFTRIYAYMLLTFVIYALGQAVIEQLYNFSRWKIFHDLILETSTMKATTMLILTKYTQLYKTVILLNYTELILVCSALQFPLARSAGLRRR